MGNESGKKRERVEQILRDDLRSEASRRSMGSSRWDSTVDRLNNIGLPQRNPTDVSRRRLVAIAAGLATISIIAIGVFLSLRSVYVPNEPSPPGQPAFGGSSSALTVRASTNSDTYQIGESVGIHLRVRNTSEKLLNIESAVNGLILKERASTEGGVAVPITPFRLDLEPRAETAMDFLVPSNVTSILEPGTYNINLHLVIDGNQTKVIQINSVFRIVDPGP
jgi:hypothetical protein